MDNYLRFGTPIEIPFGLVPSNAGVILVSDDGRQKTGVFDPRIRAIRQLTNEVSICGMRPKNKDLHLLYDHLQNDDVEIVIVDGLFGTGKTSTIMAHVCDRFIRDIGFTLYLSKPHVPVGRTYGHLPGDLDQKTNHEFASFYQYIERFQQLTVEELKLQGRLNILPLEYIRGRDIPEWLIIDEAQNLTEEEAISFTSRLADGGKLILLGDTSYWQRDRKGIGEPGISFIYELLKDSGLVGYVELKTVDHILRGRTARALAKALINGGKSDSSDSL